MKIVFTLIVMAVISSCSMPSTYQNEEVVLAPPISLPEVTPNEPMDYVFHGEDGVVINTK